MRGNEEWLTGAWSLVAIPRFALLITAVPPVRRISMTMRLDEEFTSHGRFWQPDLRERSVAGRLVYSPAEGPAVELSESFGSEAISILGPDEYPVLHGQLLRGDLITLFGCIVKTQSFGGGMGSPVQIIANRAVVGCLLAGPEQPNIIACTLGFTSFENWMSISPVKYYFPQEAGRNLGVDVTYRFPDPISFAVPHAQLAVEIGQNLETNPGIASFDLRGTGYLKLSPTAPVIADAVFDLAWQFQNLLSLLVGTPVSITFAELRMVEGSCTSNRINRTYDLLFDQVFQSPSRAIHPMEMLLPLGSIHADFPTIAERWISRAKLSKAAIDVYFGSLYRPSSVSNFEFLAVIQAIESYHRSLGTGLYMEATEYEKAIQSVLANIPSEIQGDHRHSLKNRLKYGNEYSLRKRLTRMLDALPEGLRQVVTGDGVRFVQQIVDTRNYFTHYDDSSKGLALEGIQIHWATQRLRILMVVTLFMDLGVSTDNLIELLRRNANFRHTLNQPL
jgi:hypothetical protein